MTSALRWAAVRAILMFHNCEGQSHKTVSTDHNFWRERRSLRLPARPNRLTKKTENVCIIDSDHWIGFSHGHGQRGHCSACSTTRGWVVCIIDSDHCIGFSHGHGQRGHCSACSTTRGWVANALGLDVFASVIEPSALFSLMTITVSLFVRCPRLSPIVIRFRVAWLSFLISGCQCLCQVGPALAGWARYGWRPSFRDNYLSSHPVVV